MTYRVKSNFETWGTLSFTSTLNGFLGTFQHNLTVARQWTLPDLTGYIGVLSTTNPSNLGTASPGTSTTQAARADHVHAFSATAPLSWNGTVLSISQVSRTVDGYLSATDYSKIFDTFETRHVINDTDYTVTGTNNQTFIISAITTTRNIYLPPATTIDQTLLFIDESGQIDEATPLLGHAYGSDTINGQLYARFVSPYNVAKIRCTDVGKWTLEHTNIRNLSAGIIYSPTITDNGNGSITIGNDGGYALFANPSGAGNAQVVAINGGTYTLTDGVTNYVVANFNNNSPIIQVITDVTLINETTIIPINTIYRQGNLLRIFAWDTLGDALVNKIHKSIVKTQRYRAEPGSLPIGETPTRYVTIGSGTVWTGAVPTILAAFNSSVNRMQFAYHVGGVWTFSNITQYNNTQYDDGTNLQNTSGGKYVVNFIYRSVGNDTEAFLVLGNQNYGLGAAQTAQPPANLPSVITSHCILVGRIIVSQGAITATQIDSAFNTLLTPSGVTDHNSLSNLQAAPNPVAGEYFHLSSAQATIATQASSATLDGYLLHTDWITFNSKEPAIASGTTSQYWRGDKTWQNLTSDVVTEGTTNLYFTQSRVLATPLTGYVVGSNAALAATDTILQAFGKVQGQINNLQPLDGDLTAIAGLTGTSGLLRKTAANTWTLDTTVYLSGTSSLNAANLTGTIPSTVLANSTLYIGTTAIALNRASAAQALTGITSIDGSAAKLTTPVNINGTSFDGSTSITVPVNSTDDTATNSTYYPLFSVNINGNYQAKTSSTKLTYNPSTGNLSSTLFTGSGAGLTNLPANNLTGTISSTVLGNSYLYIGTTQIYLNQATNTVTALTGITSIDGGTLTLGATSASTINIATATTPQTVNIGTGSGATTINIGGSGDTVNIGGTLAYVNTTDLTVTDKLITINKGGAASSGDASGIQVEENALITGFFQTGNSRNSWTLQAPARSGILWLTPSSGAFTTEIAASSTANRTFTLPDNSGTFALTSDLSAYQPLDGDLTAIAGLSGTSGLLRKTAANTWSLDTTAYGTGSVTSVSIVSANGFAGTVATASTTPAITLTTTITGMLKGNGTAISAATSGTDYSAGTSTLATGVLKSTNGTGTLSIASGSDLNTTFGSQTANYVYAAPNGSAGTPSFRALVAADIPILNQNTTGTAAAIAGGTAYSILYQSATNVTSFLAGNTTTTPQFLTSTGTGSAAQAPTWTGSTGSGNVVLATSPTLTTPNIGAATATSLSYAYSGDTSVTLTTSTTTANQVVDSVSVSSVRGLKYVISITSGTSYQVTEILIVHDGTTPVITEYGTLFTGSSLASFDSDISGGNVRLLTTPVNAVTTIKARRISIFV